MKYYVLFFVWMLSISLFAQTDFKSLEKDLAFNADIMVNASKSQHRETASKLFLTSFLEILQDDQSFNYPFDSLEWISKLNDENGSFRIFTWQLFHSNDSIDYFGVFQSADSVIQLQDEVVYNSDLKYEELSAENWFGQIYYDLKTFTHRGVSQSYLFGTRMLDENTRVKTIEPFSWNGNAVKFGKELFYNSSRHGLFRLMIEYFAQATARLRYDEELDLIVYDHLIPVINPYESDETIYVPDGTLEAYVPQKGIWNYKEKVFDQIYSEPPVPEPILKDRNKDILGR